MDKARNYFTKSFGLRQTIHSLFLLFCSLNFQNVDAEITFCSDGRNEGYRLNSTVHDNRHALSRIDCVVQCVYEPCCRSTNYRKSHSFDGKENCELLQAVLSEHLAEDLKEDKDYDYTIVVKPIKSFNCECSSCENNGECDTSTKQCLCPPGFTGNQCEKADITGYMTIDNSGSISADGKIVVEKTNSWKQEVSFSLPGNTSVIVIEGDNGAGSPGAILASFSIGILTDQSWECISGDSRSGTTWPKAISYGTNIASVNPWGPVNSNRAIDNIAANAHWIWTSNKFEINVVCRKILGAV